MKFKVMMIKAVVLFFISISALASSDEYFFPGGTWTGSYTVICNNQSPITGTAIMQVQPLSITEPSQGTFIEDFAGSLKLVNLPSQCNPPIDFRNGVYFAKGTMAKASSVFPPLRPSGITMLVSTNTGTVNLGASYPSLTSVIISTMNLWENFNVTIDLVGPQK